MPSRHIYGREVVAALTAAEATAWDAVARDQHGIPERLLMENAGRAVAAVTHTIFPRGRIVAVVGSGHNGADALVALRALRGWGREVSWISAGSNPPNPEVLHAWQLSSSERVEESLQNADVVIDGVLGTGTRGPARQPIGATLGLMNDSGRPIVAVDLP